MSCWNSSRNYLIYIVSPFLSKVFYRVIFNFCFIVIANTLNWGSSFNDYSCVLINGKEYTTEKVSDRLLRVNGINVKKDDVVVVAQKGDDKVELSRTTFTVKQQSKKNAQQQ